ncbi:MAG: GntR family transcriptional regulator [Rhodospirillaceae bacterium]|nr:GntR family transcriptional regulator [Rhodospirillaceae bacterium]
MTAAAPPGRRTLYEIVEQALEAQIEGGALPPGAVLRESAVAEAFAVSRIPAAMALARLHRRGLLARQPGGGFVIGRRADGERALPAQALRRHIPDGVRRELRLRNWRERIYPEVERDVAACLLFGRFQIRSGALAAHYGVSRTVAHELMTRLERVGILRQEANGRWYAGPLTAERISHLFEMRWLLEPAALKQAAPSLSRRELVVMRDRILAARRRVGRSDPRQLHRLEIDLHHRVVLACANGELRETLYRCQLPLITSHLVFGAYQDLPEIPPMLEAHRRVFDHLIAGRTDAAARALEAHLRESEAGSAERLRNLPPLATAAIPPYLTPCEVPDAAAVKKIRR